jgi:hypothetical protein
MHGGKSLDGIAHPSYKHACYSKHSILGIVMRAEVRAYRELKRKRARFDKMLAAEAARREEREAEAKARRAAFKWDAEALRKMMTGNHR